MAPDRAIDLLVQFARLVSDAATSAEALARLAEALMEYVDAAAVAVVEIGPDGNAHLTLARELPPEVHALSLQADALGAELGDQILEACGDTFTDEQTRPLVAAGDLFGGVVMLFKDEAPSNELSLRLADGLIDLAALALGNAAHVRRLEESYAQLRASQELLARSEKLRALGQMAAGVTHDLKNILNPLSLHLQVIERSLARGRLDDAKESCQEMRQVLTRGVQTIERLRSYSRQNKESTTELVDLDVLAGEAAGIARPRIAAIGGTAPRIVERFGHPAKVMAISGEVVSALVNLIVNAVDALAGRGGEIRIETGEADAGSFIEIADDGPGMPEEVQKHVFEPFFTTKGHEGTGLGLAMVYACMQRHGGHVKLATAPGKGTSFRLWFPALAER